MPRPYHPKRDIEAQKEFKKKLPFSLDALAIEFKEIEQQKKVVVFYQDEGRFGRISNEVACWVHNNNIPSIPKQMVRE